MFRKIATIVHHNGKIDTSVIGYVAAGDVPRDAAEERRAIRQETRTLGRVVHVEQTMTTLATVYTSGAVKIYQWVAE